MTDVRVGVTANTSGAEAALTGMGKASDKVAVSVEKIGVASDKTAQGIKKVTMSMKELFNVQKMLSTAFGKPVSRTNALRFVNGFSDMQSGSAGRGIIGLFPSAAEWANQNDLMHGSKSAADAYFRRTVNQAAARGGMGMRISPIMPAAPAGGPAEPTPEPGPEPEEKQPYDYGGKAKSMALDMSKAMLALAGIQGIMALAGQAINLGTTEAMQTDTLKRMMGDTGVDYTSLRDSFRNNRDGLGLTSGDLGRLGLNYARTAGIDGSSDIAGETRTAAGFGRSYGIEPDATVGFFGNMRKEGITSNDSSNRRLALMIAEAMDKGKVGSRTEEFLSVVSGFVQRAAQSSFQQGNVEQFMSYLSTLTGMGIKGVDIEGAAGLINQADSSYRQGGGKGEASLNAIMASLHQAHPGLDPFQLKFLMEGGLGGTMQGAFGKTTLGADWIGKGKLPPGMDSNETNAQALSNMLRSKGMPEWQIADSLAGMFFGGNEHKGMALDLLMKGAGNKFGGMADSLTASGIDINNMSVTGFQTMGKVMGADAGGLEQLRQDFLHRQDMQGEAGKLNDLAGKSPDEMRRVLLSLAAAHGQESDPGKDLLNATKDMEQSLTDLGSKSLVVMTDLKEIVSRIATVLGADSTYKDSGALPQSKILNDALGTGKLGLSGWDTNPENPDYAANIAGLADLNARHAKLRGTGRKLQFSASEEAAISAAAGGDPAIIDMMKANLGVEGWGHGNLDYSDTKNGAYSPAQIRESAIRQYGGMYGITDPKQLLGKGGFNAAMQIMAEIERHNLKAFGGDKLSGMLAYNMGVTGLRDYQTGGSAGTDAMKEHGIDYMLKLAATERNNGNAGTKINIVIQNTDGSKKKSVFSSPPKAAGVPGSAQIGSKDHDTFWVGN